MKRTKYLILGTMIMLLAGTVYTWTIIAKSISATYPSWSAQALSMTFTITMMGYALGGMASGIVVRRIIIRRIIVRRIVIRRFIIR